MKKNKEQGSITVETVIGLTLFVLFFVVMLNFINIAFIQIRVQHALANTSYEMSVFSYLGTKSAERGGSAVADDYMFTVMYKEPRDGHFTVYRQDDNFREMLYKLGENPDLSREMIKKLMNDYLRQLINGDKYLKRQGVVDGIDGLHYELSEYNQEEGYIRVSVYYKYRIIGLPFLDAGIDLNIFQNSTSKLWK